MSQSSSFLYLKKKQIFLFSYVVYAHCAFSVLLLLYVRAAVTRQMTLAFDSITFTSRCRYFRQPPFFTDKKFVKSSERAEQASLHREVFSLHYPYFIQLHQQTSSIHIYFKVMKINLLFVVIKCKITWKFAPACMCLIVFLFRKNFYLTEC